MGLSLNTNISALVAQRNLASSTNAMNKALERLTTGFKINRASDNAANYSIMRNWEAKLSSLDVAAENTATGTDLASTAEGSLEKIQEHLKRIRDITEQAANGTYDDASRKAMATEVKSRLEEIDRISDAAEFNGVHLLDGSVQSNINIQVGTDSQSYSQISLDQSLFADADSLNLFSSATHLASGNTTIEEIAESLTGYDLVNDQASTTAVPHDALQDIDDVINNISGKLTQIGSYQNRFESATDSIAVQIQNITSALSTIKDADVAKESTNYIQAQIMQQAATTLLATANQNASIALNLI